MVASLVLGLAGVACWQLLSATGAAVQVASSATMTPRTAASQSTLDANSAIPGPGAPGGPAIPPAVTTTGSGLPLRAATAAKVPDDTRQLLVVEGEGRSSSRAVVRYFERRTTWVEVATWTGNVGKSGWSARHVEGDLRTPVGVFTLTDAGGRLADPGTRLSYDRSTLYRAPDSGPGFGDSAADTFDYVIAIDYNRVPGRPPLDYTRPLGNHRGGGIWLHVDHRGPTHGCVSVPKSAMRFLLTRLQPASRPVIVMGPRQSL